MRADLLDEAGEMKRDLRIGRLIVASAGATAWASPSLIDLHHPGDDMVPRVDCQTSPRQDRPRGRAYRRKASRQFFACTRAEPMRSSHDLCRALIGVSRAPGFWPYARMLVV
jgi:hypothetical protein